MGKIDVSNFVPETLGGSHDNYYNRIVDWIHSSKFRSLVRQTKPKRIMEIGVYQCDGTKMMINEARKAGVKEIEYYGFDLFDEPPKDEYPASKNVWDSKVVWDIEKVDEFLSSLGIKYRLFKGDTKETLPKAIPNLPKMDFIYIDGGHSYETAKSDWENCEKLMHDRTVVVFDDYEFCDGVTKLVSEIGRSYDVKAFVRLPLPNNKIKCAVVRRLN